MARASTSIRVSYEQRERLRQLAAQRSMSISDTLDDALDALDALRREQFFRSMADAEAALRADPTAHADYLAERDAWLEPDLSR